MIEDDPVVLRLTTYEADLLEQGLALAQSASAAVVLAEIRRQRQNSKRWTQILDVEDVKHGDSES